MNDQSFDEFVRASSRSLLRSAWLLTGNSAEAEDLVQSVLGLVWQQWPTVNAAQSPDAYVQKMLVNVFLSGRRRVRWRREVITPEPPDVAHTAATDEHLEQIVAEALEDLPSRQRAVLVLRYFCDFSVEETARTLRCSTGNVKSQASRAVARLGQVVALRELREDAS